MAIMSVHATHAHTCAGVGGDVGSKDWNQMRKHLVDNTGSYLARKEERLQAKKTKPTRSSHSPPQDSNHTPDVSKTPPSKKCKTDKRS